MRNIKKLCLIQFLFYCILMNYLVHICKVPPDPTDHQQDPKSSSISPTRAFATLPLSTTTTTTCSSSTSSSNTNTTTDTTTTKHDPSSFASTPALHSHKQVSSSSHSNTSKTHPASFPTFTPTSTIMEPSSSTNLAMCSSPAPTPTPAPSSLTFLNLPTSSVTFPTPSFHPSHSNLIPTTQTATTLLPSKSNASLTSTSYPSFHSLRRSFTHFHFKRKSSTSPLRSSTFSTTAKTKSGSYFATKRYYDSTYEESLFQSDKSLKQKPWLPNTPLLSLKIHYILTRPQSCRIAYLFNIVFLMFVFLSISLLAAGSMVDSTFSPTYLFALFVMECFSTTFFSVEYITRIMTWPPHRYWSLFTNLYTWSDVLAILPFWIDFILTANNLDSNRYTMVWQVFQLSRVIRLFKVTQTSKQIRMAYLALKKSRDGIFMLIFIFIMALTVFSCLIYYAESFQCSKNSLGEWVYNTNDERHGQKSSFQSIPEALWWCIATITTTGYGDVVPRTVYGKIVAGGAMFCAVMMFSFPVTIFSQSLSDVYQEHRHRQTMLKQFNKLAKEAKGSPTSPFAPTSPLSPNPPSSPTSLPPLTSISSSSSSSPPSSGPTTTCSTSTSSCSQPLEFDSSTLAVLPSPSSPPPPLSSTSTSTPASYHPLHSDLLGSTASLTSTSMTSLNFMSSVSFQNLTQYHEFMDQWLTKTDQEFETLKLKLEEVYGLVKQLRQLASRQAKVAHKLQKFSLHPSHSPPPPSPHPTTSPTTNLTLHSHTSSSTMNVKQMNLKNR